MNKIYPWSMPVYMEMWNIFMLSIKCIHKTNKYTCIPSLWPFTDWMFGLLLCTFSQEFSQSQIHNSQHYGKSKAELKTWFLLQFMKAQTGLHMLSHQRWKKKKHRKYWGSSWKHNVAVSSQHTSMWELEGWALDVTPASLMPKLYLEPGVDLQRQE